MSLPISVAQAIMDTVLGRLAVLFLTGAGGDLALAGNAARQMLADYNTATADELSLAAKIISFRLHSLEALGDAADPELSLNKVSRLRGSAVSLSREAHKAQKQLDLLQRARRLGALVQEPVEANPGSPSQPAELAADCSKIDTVPGLIEIARAAMQTVDKNSVNTWSQSFQKRETAKRIADNLKKSQAEHARRSAQSVATANAEDVCLAG